MESVCLLVYTKPFIFLQGTDIQKSTDAVLKDLSYSDRKEELDVSTLISCVPNEGTLQPYQKIMVILCFSPK